MEIEKLISLIIPTYNMEKYLRKCLDSLIVSEENMQRLEVLVVNDGSKDSSSQIAHEYQEKYPQTFRVIDKENGNYGSCINRGLKEATGKYVKVLDADDYFDNIVFGHYISILKSVEVDLVITNYSKVDIKDRVFEKRTFEDYIESDKVLSFIDYLNSNYKSNFIVQMHGLTYRTRLLREINYSQLEGISYTDQQWALLPMARVKSFYYYHEESLYRYLVGREGQTMIDMFTVTRPEQLFMVLEHLSAFYEEKEYDPGYNKYLEKGLFGQLLLFYLMGLKNNVISLKELLEYDNALKKFPQVYKKIGLITFYKGTLKPVKILRKGNSIEIFLLLKIPRWIYSVIN